MKYDSDIKWNNGDKTLSESEVYDAIESYVNDGGIIFIGTDSMLKNNICKFASVVAIHCNEKKIGNYFFIKQVIKDKMYRTLQNKIFEEVDCSLEIASNVAKRFPEAKIEVHVDVGKSNKSRTRIYVDTIKGWISGYGFICKVKPLSWASYIADWHSK